MLLSDRGHLKLGGKIGLISIVNLYPLLVRVSQSTQCFPHLISICIASPIESLQLMFDLFQTPDNFYQHNRRYSPSIIMCVTYGYRLAPWYHPLIKNIYSVLDNLTKITAPGAYAVVKPLKP